MPTGNPQRAGANIGLFNRENTQAQDFFLPDFCRAQSLLLVILIGELLALIITLLQAQSTQSLWYWLGIYSLSIQSVSLTSVIILCQLRGWLGRFNDLLAGAVCWLIILLVTTLFWAVSVHYFYALPISLEDSMQRQMLIKQLMIAGLIGAVALRYFYLQQQYKKQLQLEASARLQALQARIRPHFLFNSLNVIASLTRLDASKAERAIEDLSDLIRATLDNKDELIPLQKELENGRRYLALEELRLGDRLRVIWQVDEDCMTHPVPPLSVQPLLENAVYHGIQPLPEGGTVTLTVQKHGNDLFLEVTNPRAAEAYSKPHNGRGMALRNIRQRLRVLYGQSAKLELSEQGTSYRVMMTIPDKPRLTGEE